MRKKIIINLICVILIFLGIKNISYGKMELAPTPTLNPVKTVFKETYGINKAEVTTVPSSVPLNLHYDNENSEGYPDKQTKSMVNENTPSFFSRLLNMGTSLIAVCLLIYVVLKLFYARGGGIIPQPRRNIVLLEQVQLQPQKTLVLSLVKVGAKVLLIGATEKELSMLREFELQDFPAIATKFSEDESSSAFKSQLTSILNPEVQPRRTTVLSRIFDILGFAGIARMFDVNQHNTSGKRGE